MTVIDPSPPIGLKYNIVFAGWLGANETKTFNVKTGRVYMVQSNNVTLAECDSSGNCTNVYNVSSLTIYSPHSGITSIEISNPTTTNVYVVVVELEV